MVDGEMNSPPADHYHGWRDGKGKSHVRRRARGTDHPLRPRLDLSNHFHGFEWGHGGAGPAQLALAILADALDNDVRARRLHLEFTARAIARLPITLHWVLNRGDVLAYVADIERDHAFTPVEPADDDGEWKERK
jgi:Family of unknown function (DUF6166)